MAYLRRVFVTPDFNQKAEETNDFSPKTLTNRTNFIVGRINWHKKKNRCQPQPTSAAIWTDKTTERTVVRDLSIMSGSKSSIVALIMLLGTLVATESSAQDPMVPTPDAIQTSRKNSVDEYLSSLSGMTADGAIGPLGRQSDLRPNQASIKSVENQSAAVLKPIIWQTPTVCFRKTYFEDPALEQQNFSRGFFQPAFSASRFLIQSSLYPIRRTLDIGSQCECRTANRFSGGSCFESTFTTADLAR